MRTSIARLIAVFGLLLGALAFGMAASANNGNGSSFSTGTQCYDSGGGSLYCVSEKGETNTTVSQDGTYHFETNSKGTFSFTDPYSGTSTATYTVHKQANGTQENHYALKETVTENGQTFCDTEHYHYANGQVQFDSFDVTPGAC